MSILNSKRTLEIILNGKERINWINWKSPLSNRSFLRHELILPSSLLHPKLNEYQMLQSLHLVAVTFCLPSMLVWDRALPLEQRFFLLRRVAETGL